MNEKLGQNPEKIKQKNATDGSHNSWDKVWKNLSDGVGAGRVLFTRKVPVSIYQFRQKCYFFDLMGLLEGDTSLRFLELGSGRGTTSMYLASEGATDISLVDLSQTGLDRAKFAFSEEGFPEPRVVCADVRETGLEGDSYDCIYNIGLLEHFEEPGPVLEETARLLSPGGLVFMPIVPTLPYRKQIFQRLVFNPWALFKKFIKVLIGRKPVVDSSMIRTEMGRAEYVRLAAAAGLTDVQCIPYNPYVKVNDDGTWCSTAITLRGYRFYYFLKCLIKSKLILKTWSPFESCFLLIASKE